MPKPHNPKLAIRLDLLRPQSNPEQIYVKLIRWLLSTGRFIFIFVEGIVLIAFIARFKLDADLAAKKESIEQQIPYIESLKPYEILIRQTQLKISTMESVRQNYVDFAKVLKKIADQTPTGLRITNLSIDRNLSKASIQLSGQAQSNNDVATFVGGLKQDPSFSAVNITSIGLEKTNLIFSLSAQADTISGGKSL